ncbi:hypothetical protein SMMN14_01165 [Sphaerulina musiva]
MSAFTEANRKAFDELSATYNTKPWQHELKSQVATALQARTEWIGAEWISPHQQPPGQHRQRDVRLLDYACGTGAITLALGPYVTQTRALDISEKMVQQYNDAARASGLTAEQACARVGNLLVEEEGEGEDSALEDREEWYEFDVVAVGLGFHHFENPGRAVKQLAKRLKAQTGVLVIVDFLPFEKGGGGDNNHGSSSSTTTTDMAHTLKRNGFTGEEMRDMYTAAGFEDFDIVALKQPARMELSSGTVYRRLFIAKGRKGATVMQKLGNWIGGLQDWAAGGWNASGGTDTHTWDPGFANDVAKQEGSIWGPEKRKAEDYSAMPKKDEPYRDTRGWNMGLPRDDA